MAAKGITIKIRADVREAEKAMAAMTQQADKVKNLSLIHISEPTRP